MAELPNQPTTDDPVNPWNIRELILDTGHTSAMTIGRWQQALDLTNEITTSKRERGASAHNIARTRFNNYGPLLRLERLAEAEQLLRDCQDVFETAGDIPMLGQVYTARADLEAERDHVQDAIELQHSALRLLYVHPDLRAIAVAHHNLATHLSSAPAAHRAHRLAA